MKALTVWQPYAAAIAIGEKLIENRTWRPTPGLLKIGDYFAIHAAIRPWSEDDAIDVADLIFKGCKPGTAPAPFGTVVTYRMWFDYLEATKGKVVAIARLDGFLAERPDGEQAKWWCGPIAWVLGDVRRVSDPVPVKGRQGLWDLVAADGGAFESADIREAAKGSGF
jgi:activating signal cointegrator 1